jgi:hypothetical protein
VSCVLQNGFSQISEFYYPARGNNGGVWQKVISPPKGNNSAPGCRRLVAELRLLHPGFVLIPLKLLSVMWQDRESVR